MGAIKEKIVFFFPWKEVSGGPVYLSDLAKRLASTDDYDVWYVDYADGLTCARLSQTQVHQIQYYEPFSLPFYQPITLITPIYCASHIPLLHPQSKILFVNWHNYCIQALQDIWRLSCEDLQSFLQMVHRTDSVFFLDRTHWLAQNEWVVPRGAYTFKERYVPVTAEWKKTHCCEKLVHPGELHAAVLGRLCKDKVYSVINLIHQLRKLKSPQEKHLYIIGDGTEADLVLQEAMNDHVHIHMLGTVTGQQLTNILKDQVDILFAMGLSILEGAAIGLPSVVVPHNIRPFSIDAYAFLQDCRGYSLGWYDTQVDQIGIQMHTLEEIVEALQHSGAKRALGQAAAQYLENTHLDNTESAKEAISGTKLEAKDFQNFAKRQGKIFVLGVPLGKLRSSFDESEKIVDFCGIKNFLKCKSTEDGKAFSILGLRQSWITAKREGNWYRLFIKGKKIPFIRL